MSERYSEGDGDGATAGLPVDAAEWRRLVARLLPGVDLGLLARALRDEEARAATETGADPERPSHPSPAERELHRLRAALSLGGAARQLQHSINNPLTALLAEAQLLEFEPLSREQQLSVARIIELARRIASVVRQPDVESMGPPAR